MVFVLDKRKKPLMPCSEKRARLLLTRKKAVVHKRYPFTIRLKERIGGELQPIALKLDPGSKTTGVALVRESAVIELMELQHRGAQISEGLKKRAAYRRNRRSRKTRYRAPRFDNRAKSRRWLAPSLQHRVDNTAALVAKLRSLAPITSLSQELVRFDMQKMENPEISGIEYQQGTLAGCEVREYLLLKFNHTCVYCGAKDCALNLDHIDPRSKGGSDRVSNLVLACIPCNQKKRNRPLEEFVKDKSKAAHIRAQAKAPLKDAAAVNATRWALYHELKAMGLPVEVASGGRTKWNRTRLGIPKTHALDAACVGRIDDLSGWEGIPTLEIKTRGRGDHCRTNSDASGFPRGYLMRQKTVHGFQTGDMVRATVPAGKKAGIHTGRVAVRASGSFNVRTKEGLVQGIHARHFVLIQRADGHSYHKRSGASSPASKAGASAPGSR